MNDVVECLSSASYPGMPVRLLWEGLRRNIAAILDRSHTPAGYRFRVKTTDGLFFELFYNVTTQRWDISPITEDQ
jgi:hypothetical protein